MARTPVSALGAGLLADRFAQLLLAPVALLIAAIGHDWPKFAAEAWRRMWRLAELMKGGNPTDEYTGYSRRTRGRFTRPDDREGADRE